MNFRREKYSVQSDNQLYNTISTVPNLLKLVHLLNNEIKIKKQCTVLRIRLYNIFSIYEKLFFPEKKLRLHFMIPSSSSGVNKVLTKENIFLWVNISNVWGIIKQTHLHIINI